jgi:hypothetical protein
MLAINLPLLTPSSVLAQFNSTLLVSVTASLKDVMEEIKLLYQQAKPHVNINYNFGAWACFVATDSAGGASGCLHLGSVEAGGYFQASRKASSVVLAAF